MPAALLEEHLEEVLLRIPPDDPASIVRAALVSKRWCRLVCGRRFRRRFREFHGGKPPLLGFVRQFQDRRRDRTAAHERFFFIPSSTFRPRDHHDHADRRNLRLSGLHSCHGRILLYSSYWFSENFPEDLFVWDPFTDKLRKLPRWPLHSRCYCIEGSVNAAVLCASAVAAAPGDSCDHLDCHHGPFMVVLAGIEYAERTFICTYSSEADSWSEPIFADGVYSGFEKGNSVLVGTAIYFKCRRMSTDGYGPGILKYDLLTREISPIGIPRGRFLRRIKRPSLLLAMEDGRIGLASFSSHWSTLYLWSREHDDSPNGDAGWAQSRVMELDKLLQKTMLSRVNTASCMVAFADTGAGGGLIFIWTGHGLLSFDLKSGGSKVLRGSFGDGHVVPFLSFCTPALGTVSVDGAPGGGEPSA